MDLSKGDDMAAISKIAKFDFTFTIQIGVRLGNVRISYVIQNWDMNNRSVYHLFADFRTVFQAMSLKPDHFVWIWNGPANTMTIYHLRFKHVRIFNASSSRSLVFILYLSGLNIDL